MSDLLLSDVKWYLFKFDKPFDIVRTIVLWLTIALLVVFALCATLLKGENKKKFLRYGGISFIIYACIAGIIFLTLTFIDNKDDMQKIIYIPIMILLLSIGINAIAFIFVKNKTLIIESAITISGSFIATIICLLIKYSHEGFDGLMSLPLYLSTIAVIVVIIAITFFVGKNDKKGFDTRSITYGAACIALSFALSYLRILKLPQGGSVTVFSLLPLMIYSFMFGIKKGVFVCMIYGILQAIQDPWIVHPAQFLLDYPVAYACIGLAGSFRYVKSLDKVPQLQLVLGGIVAGSARFVMHFLSGVFAFSSYAGEQNAVIYSLGYNSFVFADIAIAIFAGVLLMCSKSFLKEINRYNLTEKIERTSDTDENN